MNPYPPEGTPSQQRPDPYISRNAEFAGGRSPGGSQTMQQGVQAGFRPASVLTPYVQPNGQTRSDLQRSMVLNAYR